jgi:hypothetical protein
MDKYKKEALIFVTILFILIGGMIGGLVLQGEKRVKIDCRIELGRSGRTVVDIVEICK